MNFFDLADLTFEKPDMDTFRGLALATEAAKKGGSMPTVFNAANEAAVRLFLKSEISFLEIPEIIGESMNASDFVESPDVDDILSIEAWTLEFVKQGWKQ